MRSSRFPAFAPLLALALGSSLSPLVAADTALGGLVKKFTEKRAAEAAPLPAAQPTTAQPVAQPVGQTMAAPAKIGPEAANSGGRKPSPPLASLPTPRAQGPLKILLVDDDASSNNAGGDTGVAQRSDEIFRDLVSKAVGGKAEAWSVEVVKARDNGPAFERLRGFNVVLWYTGASYGSNNDTIGREDEKTLRRYLEETGGSVILVSPGYVNNLVYGQSWDAAEHPFLKEVLAVNGCYGLVQRAARGTVRAHDGTEFRVEHPSAAEAQFSVVNPDGAALVFTSPLETAYAKTESGGGLPVAVANAFGGGRIVYVGFTFENIPEKERAKAFGMLLGAATGSGEKPVAAASPLPVAVTVAPGVQTYTPAPVAPPVPVVSYPRLSAKYASKLTRAKVRVFTGDDALESSAQVICKLWIAGGGKNSDGVLDPNLPYEVAIAGRPNAVSSYRYGITEFILSPRTDLPAGYSNNLDAVHQYGLRLEIIYEPYFFLDAWKIERLDLELEFQHDEVWEHKVTGSDGRVHFESRWKYNVVTEGFPKTIQFSRGALLNGNNKTLKVSTDRFLLPQ